MKYICLVYLVENEMKAMSKKEADACVEEGYLAVLRRAASRREDGTGKPDAADATLGDGFYGIPA